MSTDSTPQMRCVEGVGLRPYANGLLVDGGGRAVRLGLGPSEQRVALRLAHHIRHGEPLDAVTASLGLPPNQVARYAQVLTRVGALTTAPAITDAPTSMVRHMERTLGVAAGSAALQRLRRSMVRLGAELADLAPLLEECGVQAVTTPKVAAAHHDTPILHIRTHQSLAGARSVNEPEGVPDAPTLLVTLRSNDVTVGPLCGVLGGMCLRCVPLPPMTAGDADPVARAVGSALAVSEAVRTLAAAGNCRTSRAALRVVAGSGRQEALPVWRDAGCGWCGISSRPVSSESQEAYQRLQAADVPVSAQMHRPLAAIPTSTVNATMRVVGIPAPADRTGDDAAVSSAFDAVRHALGRPAAVRVGGARLLNYFAVSRDGVVHLEPGTGAKRLVPARRMAANLVRDRGRLAVLVAATLSRAERLYGARARLTVLQDTGYAIEALAAAATAAGLRASWSPAPAWIADHMDDLCLDPARDLVTAVVTMEAGDGVISSARPRPRPRPRRSDVATPADIEMLIGRTEPGIEPYAWWPQPGGRDQMFRWERDDARLLPVDQQVGELTDALRSRGIAPSPLVILTSDISAALAEGRETALDACAIHQSRAIAQMRSGASRRGLAAAILSGLPAAAFAPDGLGWRTRYRSFAALAFGVPGAFTGLDEAAVRW